MNSKDFYAILDEGAEDILDDLELSIARRVNKHAKRANVVGGRCF